MAPAADAPCHIHLPELRQHQPRRSPIALLDAGTAAAAAALDGAGSADSATTTGVTTQHLYIQLSPAMRRLYALPGALITGFSAVADGLPVNAMPAGAAWLRWFMGVK
jgi:hypothetical protein